MSFKSLVSAVSEQCNEIKQSLALFPYFDAWDENLIAECCRLGSIAEFPPDKIILGSETGNPHVVYFLLGGICRIVQCLQVQVKANSYKNVIYKLYRPASSASLTRESVDSEYSSMLLSQKHDFQRNIQILVNEALHIENSNCAKGGQEKDITNAVCEKNLEEVTCENKSKFEENQERKNAEKGSEDRANKEVNVEVAMRLDRDGGVGKTTKRSDARADGPTLYAPDHHLKILVECKRKSKETIAVAEKGHVCNKPKDAKTFFVQTGVLIKGACFGLEKNIKDSFVMSGSKVKCLRIPRSFLLRHSSRNIWNRIQLFHRLYLPTDEEILDRLVSERNWTKGKGEQTETIVALKKIPNYTLNAAVPYSIRLAEVAVRE